MDLKIEVCGSQYHKGHKQGHSKQSYNLLSKLISVDFG